MSKLNKQNALTQSELDEIQQLVAGDEKGDCESLKERIRMKRVLRWSEDEIKAGRKVLDGGIVVPLSKALEDRTIVKMDTTAIINGKATELSNFFYATYGKTKDDVKVLNEEFYKNYLDALRKDVHSYSTGGHQSFMKVAKRLWKMSDLMLKFCSKEDKEKAKRVYDQIVPLFKSNTSVLYQIKGQVEALVGMFKKGIIPPQKEMDAVFHQMESKIGPCLKGTSHELETKKLSDSLNSLKLMFSQAPNPKTPEFAENALKRVEAFGKLVSIVVNEQTEAFMAKQNLLQERLDSTCNPSDVH